MKRVIYLIAIILTGATTLISCRDTPEKETVIVKEVRVETEKAEPVPVPTEERKGILQRTAEKVDNKVNKEIDKEIDKIGDDN